MGLQHSIMDPHVRRWLAMDTEGEIQVKAENSSDVSTNQATPGISRKPPELKRGRKASPVGFRGIVALLTS